MYQRFCMKTSNKDTYMWDWPKGQYCIFKKGYCPNGKSALQKFYLYTGTCNAPVFCFSMVLSFFCQPHNLMYLRAALTDFNETWSQ